MQALAVAAARHCLLRGCSTCTGQNAHSQPNLQQQWHCCACSLEGTGELTMPPTRMTPPGNSTTCSRPRPRRLAAGAVAGVAAAMLLAVCLPRRRLLPAAAVELWPPLMPRRRWRPAAALPQTAHFHGRCCRHFHLNCCQSSCPDCLNPPCCYFAGCSASTACSSVISVQQ